MVHSNSGREEGKECSQCAILFSGTKRYWDHGEHVLALHDKSKRRSQPWCYFVST